MNDLKRCSACSTEKPVSEMKTCMHAQMHRYVCDTKCMNDFYNPPPKPVKAMSDKPEVVSYWYAFDSAADKPYIKKEKSSGLLVSFDCAEDAQRFCQWRQDVKYKEAQYVRLSDHESAMALLTEQKANWVGRAKSLGDKCDQIEAERDELLGLLRDKPGWIGGEWSERIDAALAQQGKEGGD